jgi:hypothetical protein
MFGKKQMYIAVLMILVFCCSGFCLAADPAPTATPVAVITLPFILEIETFDLVNGEIVAHKDASGGKAVVAKTLEFTATKAITLTQPGIYEITIYENTPDGNSDAINISVNDLGALRTFPNEAADIGKFAACIKKYVFEVKAAGGFSIKIFTNNQMGALYDRIELKLIKAN